MEDLAQLQSRVEAARDRLGGVEADQRKYGLRLDDLVRIVEGALSRQSADLKAARIRAASLETELDDARNAISRHEVDLAAKETDLVRLAGQNEQLRGMVMTLLELVEGRSATPLREAMIRLEHGVRDLLTETGAASARAPATPRAEIPPTAPAPADLERAPPAPAPMAPMDAARTEAPAMSRPVLVPNQTLRGRIPAARPAPAIIAAQDLPDTGDALIELTSVGRSNADQIVKEPPDAPANASTAQLLRRLSDAADA